MKALIALYAFTVLSPAGNSATTMKSLVDLPGVAIHVEPVAWDLQEAGMTAFVFDVEIERCLKQAGVRVIKPEHEPHATGAPTLSLSVSAMIDEYEEHCTYSISLGLTQTVVLERDPEIIVPVVPTWRTGGMGACAKGWRQALLDDVVSLTDEFIDVYLTANPKLGDARHARD